jgi:hypothetical protein
VATTSLQHSHAPSAHIAYCSVHCRLAAAQQQVLVLPGALVADARCFSVHPASIHHMHCLCPLQIHCSPVQRPVLVQPEREWLRRSLFQHAHASIHAHASALSTADSLQPSAAASLGAGPSVSGYDAHCFSMHTPQSTHMHCFVHCRFTAAQCSTNGAAWSVSGYDARCFSIHTLHPRHALLSPL